MVINWGILGCGRIANKFVQDLLKVQDACLYAVASRDKQKAKEFQKKYGAIEAFDSYERMVKDERVDIVYVATPHMMHYHHTMLCFSYDKAVLCEKPIALNAEQTADMIDMARRKELFLMEALWTRFLPNMETLLELLQQGEIGSVRSVSANFCFPSPFDRDHRLYDPDQGGGSLLDLGIYPVFLAYLLMGRPMEILADALFAPTEVDEFCSMIFKYERSQNRTALLHSGLQHNSDLSALIIGEWGNIEIHPRWHESEAITVRANGKPDREIRTAKLGKGYTHEIMACHDMLNQKKIEHPKWTHQNSLEMMRILDEIRAQIRLKYPGE